jgi:hypothetical protein
MSNWSIIAALQQIFYQRYTMFKNTPFESIAKTMSESAPKMTPAAMQEAIKPVQDNLKAWADLAQHQAQEAQAVITETMESIKGAKDPQTAFEVMKASAEAGMALFAKNLSAAASLSVGQFNSGVDAIEKASPAPEAFAGLAKNLKAAANTAESNLATAMEKGAAAVATATKATKKSR